MVWSTTLLPGCFQVPSSISLVDGVAWEVGTFRYCFCLSQTVVLTGFLERRPPLSLAKDQSVFF